MVCSKKPPKTIRVRAKHQQHQESEQARLERNRKRREQRQKNRTAKMGDDSDWEGGWEDHVEEGEEEEEEQEDEEDDDNEEGDSEDSLEGGEGASSAMTTAMADQIATEGNQGNNFPMFVFCFNESIFRLLYLSFKELLLLLRRLKTWRRFASRGNSRVARRRPELSARRRIPCRVTGNQ